MYCQLSPTVFQYPCRALQKILSALLTSLHSEDKRLVDKNSVEVPSVSPYLVVPLPLAASVRDRHASPSYNFFLSEKGAATLLIHLRRKKVETT